jgi:hypothetical protein
MNLIKKYNVYGTWKDRNVCTMGVWRGWFSSIEWHVKNRILTSLVEFRKLNNDLAKNLVRRRF